MLRIPRDPSVILDQLDTSYQCEVPKDMVCSSPAVSGMTQVTLPVLRDLQGCSWHYTRDHVVSSMELSSVAWQDCTTSPLY